MEPHIKPITRQGDTVYIDDVRNQGYVAPQLTALEAIGAVYGLLDQARTDLDRSADLYDSGELQYIKESRALLHRSQRLEGLAADIGDLVLPEMGEIVAGQAAEFLENQNQN